MRRADRFYREAPPSKRGFADLYGCLLCAPATIEEAEIAQQAVDTAAQHGLRGADIRIGVILGLRISRLVAEGKSE